MKRVLIIGSTTHSLLNFRGKLLDALIASGLEVHACAGECTEPLRQEIVAKGVGFHNVNLQRRGFGVVADLHYLQALRQIIRRIQPDLVLAYTIKPIVYGSLAASSAGVPQIAAMITGLGVAQQGTDLKERIIARIARGLYRHALRHVSVIFFQNGDDEQLFREQGLVHGARVVQIPGSGVDLAHFAVADPVTDPVTFLLIARLLVKKGIRDYVLAASQLRRRYGSSVRCLLVGPLESRGGISESELRMWGDSDAIEYLGPLDDVREALRQTSVFVLPSYYGEGTPRTVLEAMSMGRPIITTDSSGCRDTIVDGVNGYLIPPRDAEQLTTVMERFVQRRELIHSMGEQSRLRAEQKYDVHEVNRIILQELDVRLVRQHDGTRRSVTA